MTKWSKRLRGCLRGRDGNTLVSVMAAFVVMMIVLAMFAGVILFANRMNSVATQRTAAANAFIDGYYASAPGEAAAAPSGGLTLTRKSGGAIDLPSTGVGTYTDGTYSMEFFAAAGD